MRVFTFPMKRYQYSVRYKANAAGYVVQLGQPVAGERVLPRTTYCTDLEVLCHQLVHWTTDTYKYFLAPEDLLANLSAPVVPSQPMLSGDGELAYYGAQRHDYYMIADPEHAVKLEAKRHRLTEVPRENKQA